MAIDEYLGSDPGIKFDIYSWDTLCDHTTVLQFVKYKFDDHTTMSVEITQFMVFNYPSNKTSRMKVDLEKFKSLPDQVKSLSENLTKVRNNQNYT